MILGDTKVTARLTARLTATQATSENRESVMELILDNGRVVYSSSYLEGNEVEINKAIKEHMIEEVFYKRGIFLVSFIRRLNARMIGEE